MGCCLCDCLEGIFCCACSLVKWVISTILGVIIIIAIVFCIGYFGFGWFKHDDPTKLASLTIPDEMEPLTRGNFAFDFTVLISSTTYKLIRFSLNLAGRSIILRTIGAGMQ